MAYDPDEFADDMMSGFLGGYTAGRKRRLARQSGKDPGAINTFIEGLQLARTMPRTPEQQIDFARASLQQDYLRLQQTKQATDIMLQKRELDMRDRDSALMVEAYANMQDAANNGNYDFLRAMAPPAGLSPFGRKEFLDAKAGFINRDLETRAMSFRDLGDQLVAMGVSSNELPSTLGARQVLLDEKLGIRQGEVITKNVRDFLDSDAASKLEEAGINQLSINRNTGQISVSRYPDGTTGGASLPSVSYANALNKIQGELDQLNYWLKQPKHPLEAEAEGYPSKDSLRARIQSLLGQARNLQATQGMAPQTGAASGVDQNQQVVDAILKAAGSPGVISPAVRGDTGEPPPQVPAGNIFMQAVPPVVPR